MITIIDASHHNYGNSYSAGVPAKKNIVWVRTPIWAIEEGTVSRAREPNDKKSLKCSHLLS